MNIKESLHHLFHSFFVIFSGSVLAMYAYSLIFGVMYFELHNITALLVLTVLTDLAYFIFYSKKELSKRQMLVRHILHFAAIMVITLSTADFMGWVSREEPIQILVFAGLVSAVYFAVIAFNLYQSKRLADRLTRKLRERYKE